MSDPEDAQDDVSVPDGDFLYQLRRIGPPATIPKVPDIMRLRLGLTKIGRGQHNDYYIDSAKLKNFISRSHVEIYGKKNENGKVEFVLTDKGLNGTFINDIRTHKTCVLDAGCKITFGHTNGYKIEPGSHAEQPQSEFQFVFEKIPKTSKTSEVFVEELTSDDFPHQDSPEPSVDTKKESVPERPFLSDIQSNLQSVTQEKISKSKSPQKSRVRQDSSSQSDSEVVDNSSRNSSVVKGSKKSGKSSPEHTETSVKREQAKKRVTQNQSRSSRVSVQKGKEEEEEKEAEETLVADDGPEEMEEEVEEEDEEEDEEEEEVKEVKKKVPKKKKSALSVKKSKGKKAPVPPPSDSEESSDNDSSKPEADQRPKPVQSSSKQKPPPRRKRASLGNDAPAIGSRKRRRRTNNSASTAKTAPEDNDLEPGVEWYDDETCESADCKRPKKKRTPWVQCDDCDSWYHTVCVGANYNQLKDSDAHFNCGCVQSD